MPTNEQIRDYLLRTIDYLDGYGLVITDRDMLEEKLAKEFPTLREMFNNPIPQSER